MVWTGSQSGSQQNGYCNTDDVILSPTSFIAASRMSQLSVMQPRSPKRTVFWTSMSQPSHCTIRYHASTFQNEHSVSGPLGSSQKTAKSHDICNASLQHCHHSKNNLKFVGGHALELYRDNGKRKKNFALNWKPNESFCCDFLIE